MLIIVETALSEAINFDGVLKTGEDKDIFVLSTAFGYSTMNVYFQKAGEGNTTTILYSSHSFNPEAQYILFLHAISGCDTTFHLVEMEKKKVMQLYNNSSVLFDMLIVFPQPNCRNWGDIP